MSIDVRGADRANGCANMVMAGTLQAPARRQMNAINPWLR
jgi:hypothetical protein